MGIEFFKGKRVHMIGIGGAGMTAIAEILKDTGAVVSGSDCLESKNTCRLLKEGFPVHIGHSPDNVSYADICIYSAAIADDNDELAFAKLKIPTLSRAEALGIIASGFDRVTAVAGTHGKTTVSSMIAHILKNASWIIGGDFRPLYRHGMLNNSDLIIEGCEYAQTFLKIKRDFSVILNIDNDHLEYYGNRQNLVSAFEKFALGSRISFAFSGDPDAVKCAEKAEKTVTFGFLKSDSYYAANLHENRGKYSFDVISNGAVEGRLHLKILGRHNIINALAAYSVCRTVYNLPFEQIKKGLETYTGAGRRFEILGSKDGVTIADDYAHHPAEIAATLNAARKAGYNKITAVFQPFTFSRTKMLLDDFIKALSIADNVVVCDIMGGREAFDPAVCSGDICNRIPGSFYRPDFRSAADTAMVISNSGDLVITLGCGDVYKCAEIMLKK